MGISAHSQQALKSHAAFLASTLRASEGPHLPERFRRLSPSLKGTYRGVTQNRRDKVINS